ncbi:MAG: HAMP domain-containing sensor histidine kinase [Pseudomonadota bacterium]
MSAGAVRRGLKSILTRQLLLISLGVILANIILVAVFDVSDRQNLIIDLMRRELLRLEAAYLEIEQQPDALAATINGIYDDYPEAYAFAVMDADGTVLNGKNVGLIPPELLRPGAFANDWLAWPNGTRAAPVIASHSIEATEPPVSLLLLVLNDPADLLGAEVFDEFRGHVWLPLIPIVVLLIGGTLLSIGRALRPVSEAAAWARAIRPGERLPPLELTKAPAEILDLTDAVQRSLERLDAELVAEQRRAAEAAHGLRTPAAVLVARLDELPPGPEFETFREDVRALSRTVTQFLSSSGADRLEVPEGARADIAAVAERVVSDLYSAAEAQGAELVLSGNGGPNHVHGAADAIALALINLVENALHHGGAGPVEVSVGPGPVLAVRDHGPGLPDKADGDLFEPFRRGTGAPRGGAGLGLAIVSRIQRAHGGKVEAEAAPGGGALFRLSYQPG